MSMKPEQYLPRLSFIRYVYTTALDKSKEPEPQSAASILSLHDSVELLLDLVCDFLGTNNANVFSDYWKLLEEKLPTMLGHKRDMLKLNKIRVSLKHHGIFPAKAVIETAAVNVTSLMEDIVLTVFKIKFEEISMIDLVRNVKSKEKLNLALSEIKVGSVNKALYNIAIAFQEVLNDYDQTRRKEFRKSPFDFAREEFVPSSMRYETDQDRRQSRRCHLHRQFRRRHDGRRVEDGSAEGWCDEARFG